MEQYALKLFNLYAHFPVVLMFAYALTLFLPLSASRVVASLIGVAITWGLIKHFDANLKWWIDTWAHTAFVPKLNAPEGLEFMMREAYVRGFFTCICWVLSGFLILVPLVANSYVRSSIAMRSKSTTAKGSSSPL
ncbi:MAG: hypothetical protein AAF499_12535 [Pseudomonadota bacterium]